MRPSPDAYPSEAIECLSRLGHEAARSCCGYGLPGLMRALDSEERRVVLIADRQEIATDQFALYRIPLPKEFQTTTGKRSIRVSLAFGPRCDTLALSISACE